MKKFVFIFTFVCILGFLTGCGNNKMKTLVCTSTNRGNNMTAEAEARYTFEDDKLKKFSAVVDFKDITVDNLDSVWDSFKAQFNEQNYPTEEEGYKRTTKADDKNHVFTVTIDVNFDKINKETMQKFNVDDSYLNKSYDEVKKLATQENLTCK